MRRTKSTVARAKSRKKKPLSAKAISKLTPHRMPQRVYSFEETAKHKATFLATLAKTGNVGTSAKAARVSRGYVYRTWRCEGTVRQWTEAELAEAEEFKALWDEALENAIDLLEKEAWRRGAKGYDKPIVFKGRVVGTYKEYSDRLLEVLLKAHRRKKFGDKTEVSGPDGGPISTVRRVERVVVDPKEGA